MFAQVVPHHRELLVDSGDAPHLPHTHRKETHGAASSVQSVPVLFHILLLTIYTYML